MSTLETNLIQPSTGTSLTIGASGDTITIPSGATITNSGTASGFGGITMAQQWRLSSDLVGDANPITSNLEVVDTDGYGGIGSGMSESSGTFTFPSTGIYLINFNITQQVTASGDYAQGIIQTTTDNASYSSAADGRTNSSSTGTAFNSAVASFMFDVTNTSTHKVQFRAVQANTGNKLVGNSSSNVTYMTFIRLGDT